MTLFQPEIVLQKLKEKHEFKQAELSRLKLEEANIDEAIFIGCYLRGAIFSSLSSKKANFKNTNLSFAKINQVDLEQANLERTEFNSAVLSQVTLDDINGYKARFFGTKFNNIQAARANLTYADLREAVGENIDFHVLISTRLSSPIRNLLSLICLELP